MEKGEFAISFKKFFPRLTLEEFERLLSISEFKTYSNKELILKSGNKQKKVFLILEGSVRGYICDEKGNVNTTLLRSKGIFVGDAEAVFSEKPQKLNLEAMDNTRVLMFAIPEFENLAKQFKGIQELYIDSLKEAILTLTYRVNTLITMTAEERYLDLLDRNPIFLKDSFDKYIANYLGITPVSFSRIKKKLNRS
jgi:CRP-like cAMP-binding protein